MVQKPQFHSSCQMQTPLVQPLEQAWKQGPKKVQTVACWLKMETSSFRDVPLAVIWYKFNISPLPASLGGGTDCLPLGISQVLWFSHQVSKGQGFWSYEHRPHGSWFCQARCGIVTAETYQTPQVLPSVCKWVWLNPKSTVSVSITSRS